LPAKKQTFKAKLKSWQLTAAVISSISLIAGGVGVFAYQQYAQAQQLSAVAESALTLGQQSLEAASEIVDQLEEAIREAEQVAEDARGKSLDEKQYEDFIDEIESAKDLWVEKKTRVLEIDAAIKQLASLKDSNGQWDPGALAVAKLIEEKSAENWDVVTSTISSLQQNVSNTQTAQGQWKNEQDRITAEKAAADAAAKAASDNLARQSTEPTGVRISNPVLDAEPCEVTPLESSPAKQSIENFVLGLASNTKTTWACGICAPGTICGRALLPNLAAIYPGFVGPPQNERDALVIVVLDENHIDLYLTEDFRSILVHEAAHARQHLKYGTLLLSSNAGYRGLPEGYTEEQAIAAVEYMADCATIEKFGRSTGAYTDSCSPSELEAAATIW
jgi:hypothetical protein